MRCLERRKMFIADRVLIITQNIVSFFQEVGAL